MESQKYAEGNARSGGRYEVRSTQELHEHPAHATLIPDAPGGFDALKASVMAEGRIRVPLAILPDGAVLCGRDRLRVARELEIANVPVEIRADLVGNERGQTLLIIDDNLSRKHFTEAQRVRMASAKLEVAQELGRARKVEGGRRGGLKAGKAGGNSATCFGKSRDLVAQELGMSGRQFDKARIVVAAADRGKSPIAELYLDGTLSVNLAHEAIKLPRAQQMAIVAEVQHARPESRRRVASGALRMRLKARTMGDLGSLSIRDPLKCVEEALGHLVKAISNARRSTGALRNLAETLDRERKSRLAEMLREARAGVEDLEEAVS